MLFILILLLVLGGIGYLVYLEWGQSPENPLPALSNTPTLMPTPTRSPISYIAEAEDAYWRGDLSSSIVAYQYALDLELNQAEFDIPGRPWPGVAYGARGDPPPARKCPCLGRYGHGL